MYEDFRLIYPAKTVEERIRLKGLFYIDVSLYGGHNPLTMSSKDLFVVIDSIDIIRVFHSDEGQFAVMKSFNHLRMTKTIMPSAKTHIIFTSDNTSYIATTDGQIDLNSNERIWVVYNYSFFLQNIMWMPSQHNQYL